MTRLAHVNIRTPRFTDTVDYYRRVIGLTALPAATRPDSQLHAWMSEEDGRASVHIQHDEAADGGAPASSPIYHHIAFDCVDPQQWRERLARVGEPFTEVAFAEARLVQFNLTDPNGLKLELTFKADS
jgi:catechol 2,3-dioxygenase-like lactoylglutathione lyase family enzyme